MRRHDASTAGVTDGNVADHVSGKQELPPKHPVHHGHFAANGVTAVGRENG